MKIPALLKNEKGFMMFLAVVLCLVTATTFAIILPRLHMGQQIAALTNLNECRAFYAAKKGIDVVKLGVKNSADNTFKDLINPGSSSGIIDAIDAVVGGTLSDPDLSAKHNEYWGEDTSSTIPSFVSNFLHIDVSETGLLHEKGILNIAVIVSRDYQIKGINNTSVSDYDDATEFNDHRFSRN